MVEELAERLLDEGLIGEIPEAGHFYRVLWDPAVEDRLAQLGALVSSIDETPIVADKSDERAEARMEDTGLQTWVDMLIP